MTAITDPNDPKFNQRKRAANEQPVPYSKPAARREDTDRRNAGELEVLKQARLAQEAEAAAERERLEKEALDETEPA